MFERFWRWLTSTASRTQGRKGLDLYQLDVPQLAKELKLAEEAKRHGEANSPKRDATTLTDAEYLVVQRIEKARQDYSDWAVLRKQILADSLAKQNAMQAINRAQQADKEFERKAASILSGKEARLRERAEIASRRRSELEVFRANNGLKRDAYPPKIGTLLKYMLLAGGVLVEGILNSVFFAQGLTHGLVHGFTYAAALAALNIGVAFGIGKSLVRNIWHRNWLRKTWGFFWLTTAFTLMVVIGLGISHMRDALTAESEDAQRLALETLLSSPFMLNDVMSWGLFAVSVMFASFALMDGLLSDDLYPGYGELTRRAKLAADDYEDELSEVRSELEELKNFHLAELDKGVSEAQTVVAMVASLIDEKKSAQTRLQSALAGADNALKALISKYRMENELHRNGEPRPAYFDVMPKLKPLSLPDFGTESDNRTLKENQELLNKLLNEVQGIRARIDLAYLQNFDRLIPLTNHFASERK